MRDFIYRCIRTIAIVIVFCVNVSCPQNGAVNMWVGVGRTVDQEAPTVDVTSPVNGGYMGNGDLVLVGTCTDNIGVNKIVVELKVQGQTKSLMVNADFEIGITSGRWSATFSKMDMDTLGLFAADGTKVNISVTAYDAMENYGFDSLFLYIDTKQPDVSWQKPDTTTRFSDSDHNDYLIDPISFEQIYSVNKPNTIGYFHNGEVLLSGFVEDNYAVASTYLRFIDESGKLCAVTPVITDFSIDDNAEVSDDCIQVGEALSDASPMSWKYNVDTTRMTDGTKWVKVEIVTKDEAGNITSQSCSPEWMCIQQDADVPRNNYNFSKGVTINVGGSASGVAFDDDGVAKIFVAAVPDNSADIESLLAVSPLQWQPTDDEEESKVIRVFESTDKVNGSSIINWAITVPIKGGAYRLFTVPYDQSGKSPDNFADVEFDGVYWTSFRVASEEDPVISMTNRVETVLTDSQVIRGSFYDNEYVKCITAVMNGYTNYKGEDVILSSSKTLCIYNGEYTSPDGDFVIDMTSDYKLTTGQSVVKNEFIWTFKASDFVPNLDFHSMKLTLKAIDEQWTDDEHGHYGNDELNIYGDSERPSFGDVTPDNNCIIMENVTFSGYAEDNVDVAKIVISCRVQDGFPPREWRINGENNSPLLTVSDSIKVGSKSRRTFSTLIKPSDIKYGTPTIVITAVDRTGNSHETTINIKGDTETPKVTFPNEVSGSYKKADGGFDVMISPVVFDKTEHKYRDLRSIKISSGASLLRTDMTSDWDWDQEALVWAKTFSIDELGLEEGDVNITVSAVDTVGNEGVGSLYFIADKTPPEGMEITSPTLIDKAGVDDLTNDADKISMERISYYLNNDVTFRGIGRDNSKISQTVLDIYTESGDKIASVIMTDTTGDILWTAKNAAGAEWNGIKSVSGSSSNYSMVLDTTAMANGNYYITIKSIDVAGNIAYANTLESDKRYFKILQDADKPRITFNVSDTDKVFNNYEITGQAFDDDGFSSDSSFRYLMQFNINNWTSESDMQAIWDDTDNAKNKLLTDIKDAAAFSFFVPDRCSGVDGFWTLWMQPIDKNDTTGDIYKLHLEVSSSNQPRVRSMSIQTTTAGKKWGDMYYAGRMRVEVNCYGGSDSLHITQIAYRIYGSSVNPIDTTADVSLIGVSNLGGWYIHEMSGTNSNESDYIEFDSLTFVPTTETLTVEVKVMNDDDVTSITAQKAANVDNENPSLSIKSPSGVGRVTIDGNVTVTGTVEDTMSLIKNIYISYHSGWTEESIGNITLSDITDSGKYVPKGSAPAVNKWHELGYQGSAAWNCEYNSTLMPDETDQYLVAAAVDNLDNMSIVSIPVRVSQDNDRPRVTISNMNLTDKSSVQYEGYIPNMEGYIIGSVNDDDGVVLSVDYALKPLALDAVDGDGVTGWKNISNRNSSFTYNSLADGYQTVYLRITDAKNTRFMSAATLSQSAIKLFDNIEEPNDFGLKDSDDKDTIIYTLVDTAAPKISNVMFSTTGGNDYEEIRNISNVIFGGSLSTLYLKFNAVDGSGIKTVQYQLNGNGYHDASADGVNAYKCAIPITDSGSQLLELYVTDLVDRTDNVRYTISVDNDKPTINIISPTAEVVDKYITVSGTASDIGSGLKALYISYIEDLNSSALLSYSANDITSNVETDKKGKWSQMALNQQWSYSFNTEKITTSVKNTFLLAVAAIDNNDNVGVSYRTVKIDQDNDRPTIKFLTTKVGADMSADNRTWITTDSISGTVTDSDGIVKFIYVKSGATGEWVELNRNDSSFTYTVDKGLTDGDNDLYFKIIDKEGGEFISASTFSYSSVIIEDADKNVYGKYTDREDDVKANTIMFVTVDTKSPQISDVKFYDISQSDYVNINSLSGQIFGGPNEKRYLKVRWTAYDKNGIAKGNETSPRVVLGSGTFKADKSGTIEEKEIYDATVDLNGVESGTKTFSIRVKDVAAEKAGTSWVEQQYVVKVDNDPPEIDFRSPNSGAIVYGSSKGNKIKGSIYDESGCRYIYVGYSSSAVEPTNWTDIQSQLGENVSAWTMNYNGSDLQPVEGEYNWPVYRDIRTNGLSGDLLIDGDIDTAQDLYIWMKATDSLGNVGVSSHINLTVLANADKPQIQITYPTVGAVVGGTIRITGSTQIEDSAVDSVWIQIDPDYGDEPFSDGDGWIERLSDLTRDAHVDYVFGSRTIGDTTVTGIRATGNVVSWGVPINAMKEFNSDSGNRKVAIRAIAIEEINGKSTFSDVIKFEVDKNSPVFGDKVSVVLKSPSKQKVYTEGVWIDNANKSIEDKLWHITGSIEDDTGIKKLTLTKTVNGTKYDSVILIDNGEVQDDYDEWFSSIEEPQTNYYNWMMNIPIDGGTRQYGSVIYELEAFENSEEKKSTKAKYVINFDSKKPEFSITSPSDNDKIIMNRILNGNDNFYSMNGVMREIGDTTANQSGFSRIAMFFTRERGGNTYIIDPMLSKGGGNDNRIAVSTLSGGTKKHGLYCRTVTGVAIHDTNMLTLPNGTKPNENNIRPGGLCIVNDVVYRITGISGQEISVGESLGDSSSDMTVYFPLAQVIDNTATESGTMNKTFQYNNVGDPADDGLINKDQDQMIEGVDISGATYNWSVTINSNNIYDGPINLCFVAFDKAGNYFEKTLNTSVKNNPPRLAGISFGSDINGDGDVSDDELNTDTSGVYDKEGLHKSANLVKNGYYPNNGGIVSMIKIPENLDESLFTIKNSVKFILEIVGGNSGLRWLFSVDGHDLSGDLSDSGSYDDTVRKFDLNLSYADLLSTGIQSLRDKVVTLRISDKTEEAVNSAEFQIRTNIILTDDTPPVMEMKKFYWNSAADNSVYKTDGVLRGHIELESSLPSTFRSDNANEFDRDPKVSGVVTFEGTAFDTVIVNKLEAKITSFSTVTIAERVGSNFVEYGDLENDGWKCEIVSDDFDHETGADTVVWKLHWDTSKVDGTAKADVSVDITAYDKGVASVSNGNVIYTNPKFASDSYKVDVVPYITGISRNNRYNSNRARSGAVPLLRGEELNTLTGYNLKNEDAAISISEDKNGGDSINMTDVAVGADNDDGTNKLTFTVPDNAVSGWLQLSVNSVSALNNINAYTQSNTETNVKAFDHNTLPDDRYVHIWRVSTNDTFAGSKNCVHPAMTKNAEGTLYASFSNYGEAKTYYTNVFVDAYVVDVSSYVGASMLGNTDDAIPNGTIQDNGVATVFYGFDPPEETAITTSPSGEINVLYAANFHGGAETSWNGTGSSTAGGLFIYDGHGTSTYAGKTRHNIYRSELYTYDNELNQFKNIRITRTDDYIYVVYYDRLTNGVKICIVNDAESGVCYRPSTKSYGLPWITLDGGYDGLDNAKRYVNKVSGKYVLRARNTDTTELFYMAPYSDGTSSQSAPGGSAWIPFLNTNFNDGLSRTNGTGESVAITTTSSGYPIVLYMDAGTGQLRQACANKVYPNTTADWNVYSVLSSTDPNYDTASDYISCVVDSSGYLHIAFQNTKGELVYAKSSNNPADGSKFIFGTSKSIDDSGTMIDLTLNGTIPYISYYSRLNSYDGMRLAFYNNDLDENNDGIPDGGWETMSAALNQKVTNVRSCIATQAKAADSNTYTAAIGFSPGADYRAAFYVGQ